MAMSTAKPGQSGRNRTRRLSLVWRALGLVILVVVIGLLALKAAV